MLALARADSSPYRHIPPQGWGLRAGSPGKNCGPQSNRALPGLRGLRKGRIFFLFLKSLWSLISLQGWNSFAVGCRFTVGISVPPCETNAQTRRLKTTNPKAVWAALGFVTLGRKEERSCDGTFHPKQKKRRGSPPSVGGEGGVARGRPRRMLRLVFIGREPRHTGWCGAIGESGMLGETFDALGTSLECVCRIQLSMTI